MTFFCQMSCFPPWHCIRKPNENAIINLTVFPLAYSHHLTHRLNCPHLCFFLACLPSNHFLATAPKVWQHPSLQVHHCRRPTHLQNCPHGCCSLACLSGGSSCTEVPTSSVNWIRIGFELLSSQPILDHHHYICCSMEELQTLLQWPLRLVPFAFP